MTSPTHSVDTVIIGAGLSGLRTADLLHRQGRSIVVLEARDRVGGRTHSDTFHGARFDIGGQWIGPSQRRALALADELGLRRFPTPTGGDQLLQLENRLIRYSGLIPPLPLHSLGALQAAIWAIESRAARVPAGDPAAAPLAREWDEHSLRSWCERYIPTSTARDLIYLTARSILSAEPEEVSFLYFLHYIRNAGAIDPLIQTRGGAQHWRFVNGAQSISHALAHRLEGHVHLGCPVSRVEWSSDGATVSAGGHSYACMNVVMTMPPPHRTAISFAPALPAHYGNLAQRMPMGHTIKALAFYRQPFWRSAGLSGEAASFHGLLSFTFDNSSHDDSVHALVAFANGRNAARVAAMPDAQRRSTILEALALLFGPQALEPYDFVAHDWNHETWGAGCPVAVSGPGTLTGYGEGLRTPIGPIHFAGTESASQWCGFMEGALESAERVVEELARRTP
jgi:monoamine oxidase